MTILESDRHPVIKIVIGEPTVVFVIVLNTIALFLDAFPEIHAQFGFYLQAIDYVSIVYFVFEAFLKIVLLGFSIYWRSYWNKFDFFIMLVSLPLLLNPFIDSQTSAFALITLLRLGRFLRFVRIMRFVPNAEHIWSGILRSLRASVSVFAVLFFLNLSLAMGATMLFGEIAPEYFGNPLISIYSLFKVFTVEGWYEIPDVLAESGASRSVIWVLRLYFMVSVLIGGILGLSLANAVFVDEMITDNNDDLEEMVRELRIELQHFRAEFQRLHQLGADQVGFGQEVSMKPNGQEPLLMPNGVGTHLESQLDPSLDTVPVSLMDKVSITDRS